MACAREAAAAVGNRAVQQATFSGFLGLTRLSC